MKKELKSEIVALIENAKITYVSSVDEAGYPNTKAMLSLQHDNLFTHYFSTNLSARRSGQFQKNPNACVYFCDEVKFKGLMLIGHIEVKIDKEHKIKLWRGGFECYYPDGIETEDYCVLEFTADRGNYYHGLENCNFTTEEFENA